MKTAARIFIWIGIASRLLYTITSSVIGMASVDDFGNLYFAPWPSYIIVIMFAIFVGIAGLGIWADYCLRTAKSATQTLAPGVLVLIFVNLIAGILMLCIKDRDLNGPIVHQEDPRNPEDVPSVEPINNDINKGE